VPRIRPTATVTLKDKKEKFSMINWLRTKLHNFLFPQDIALSADSRVREKHEADIEGLRFTVMPARGGTIVQLRSYDSKRDQHEYATYVIPDGEDISAEVGRIVSMELIRS
jgi:hypothetical protein